MGFKLYRLYVNDRWPRWLAVFLGVAMLSVLALYFATPDVPKSSVIPLLVPLGVVVFASHKASLSWIEISSDGRSVSSIPSWYARTFWGGKTISVEIRPGCTLLLCRNSAYGSFDGYSVALRRPDGSQQDLWKAYRGLGYQRCADFAAKVERQFGLPVRLLARSRTQEGIAETEWTQQSGRVERKGLCLGLAMFLLPWIGIAVRVFTSSPLKIALSGAVFWLLGVVVLWFLRIRSLAEEHTSFGWTLVWWSFEFAPLYMVVVLVTGALTNR